MLTDSSLVTSRSRNVTPSVRGDARGVPARSDHLETGLDERERGCLPDAGGRARHERYRLVLLAISGDLLAIELRS